MFQRFKDRLSEVSEEVKKDPRFQSSLHSVNSLAEKTLTAIKNEPVSPGLTSTNEGVFFVNLKKSFDSLVGANKDTLNQYCPLFVRFSKLPHLDFRIIEGLFDPVCVGSVTTEIQGHHQVCQALLGA